MRKLLSGRPSSPTTGPTVVVTASAPPLPLVPHVVWKVCNEIASRGLETEGIFRICANIAAVRTVRGALATEDTATISLLVASESVHNLCGVLTSILREQREPLIPYSLHSDLVAAISLEDHAAVERLRVILAKVPPPQRPLMQCVVHLLSQVHQKRDMNMMPSTNLGVVFGPTLMRDESEDIMRMLHLTERCDVIAQIIENYSVIFPEPLDSAFFSPPLGQPPPIVLATPMATVPSSGSARPRLEQHSRKPSFMAARGISANYSVSKSQSTSATHALWFKSFPGAASTQVLLTQAEAAAEAQLRSTESPAATAAAAFAPEEETPENLKRALRKANLAMGQLVMKLVEVVREKAAVEEENVQLRQKLDEKTSRSSSPTSEDSSPPTPYALPGAVEEAAPATTALDEPDAVMQEADRISHLDGLAFDPQSVLSGIAGLRDCLLDAIDAALPQEACTVLPRIGEMLRRSGQAVDGIGKAVPEQATAVAEVRKLIVGAADQLHTASVQISRARPVLQFSVTTEAANTARAIVSVATDAPSPSAVPNAKLGRLLGPTTSASAAAGVVDVTPVDDPRK